MGIIVNNSTVNIENYVESGAKVEHKYYGTVYKSGKEDNPDTETDDNSNDTIGKRDLWLLLVACRARGRNFESLPKFIDWAFETYGLDFDKEECYNTLREKLKGQAYDSIRDQQDMIRFVETVSKQKSKQKADKETANAFFLQLAYMKQE